MLINGYIGIVIVVVIVIIRIIPTNPKPLRNVYTFTFILENKDWNNKVILKSQNPFLTCRTLALNVRSYTYFINLHTEGG